MNVTNGYEWSTHQPLIRAVLDIYKPVFVLELGVGEYSTPVFIDYGVKYLGVDTDMNWVSDFIKKYDINILYQEIGEIGKRLNYKKISRQQRADIQEYYEYLNFPSDKPNLLFVDQDACCRLISINTLSPKFDIILYHDHDDKGFEDNSYELINDYGFNRYALTTPMTGAGVMIRQGLDKGFSELNGRVQYYVRGFMEDHKDCAWMKFERYE